jgi:type IV pilus assembly protein PilM
LPSPGAGAVSESIWKKEIHLRRKKAPKAPKAPVETPRTEVPTKSQSFWKKEIHLFRRKKAAPAPVPSPESAAAQVVSAYRVSAPLARPAHLPEFAPPQVQASTEHAPALVPEPAPPAESSPPVTPWPPRPWPQPTELAPPPSPVEPTPPPQKEPALPAEIKPAPSVEPAIAAHAVAPEPPAPAWLTEPQPPAPDEAPEPVAEDPAPVAPVVVASATEEPEHEERDRQEPDQLEQPTEPETPAKAPRAEKSKKRKGGDTKRVVGLRIGSTQLAAAHVANNGRAELVQLAQAPLERGFVIAGEVRDADGLARELKQFFASNKLPRKDIRLGIASNRIGVRIVDVPTVDDEKQFENAIRFRAQELLPIPITDAILDHVRLGEIVGENDEPLTSVLLVFAHRELVARYVDVCRTAGLRLSSIDLEAFALLRALAAPRAEDEEPAHAVVAVAVGHDRTVLAVSDGRVCSLTRVLEWGSAQLDVAIARTLDLTPSQAEPIKLAFSLSSTEPPQGISNVQLEAVRAVVKAEIGVLGRELVSSLRFYQSRPDSLAIGEVLLSGGGSQLDGFAEELQGLLGAPVRVADPFGRVEPARKVTLPEQAGSLAIAVGLGIED